MEYAKKELKLVYLDLNWEDSTSFVIQEEDLVKCARFIHQARRSGGSVLVHCAQVCATIIITIYHCSKYLCVDRNILQGKSRSATAVIAYLMAANGGRSFEESLKLVQEQRKMAEPNPTFTKILQDFAHSDAFKQIQEELLTS